MPPEAKKCASVDRAVPAPAPRRELSFRARRQIAATIFLVLAIALGLLATLIGGCAAASTECGRHCRTGEARPPQPAFIGNQGSSWELIFSAPPVAVSCAQTNPRAHPEYTRNDAALSNRANQPLLATTQWPERARADLAYPRRVSLPRDANTLLFYQSGGYGQRYQPGWSAETPVWDGACWR